MAHPIVYGPAGSTYVWSARLTLAEKGVTHELVEVPFGANREEPHLSRQPFAKVPAFEHDGFALYETQAIMRYVDERFPGTPLQPEDVHQWSRMNQIIGIVDAYAWPSIAGTILFNRVLAPRLLGARAGRGGNRRGIAARPAVPRRDRPADGGPPVSRRRACEPRRSDGDPAALFFRQRARRPCPARRASRSCRSGCGTWRPGRASR